MKRSFENISHIALMLLFTALSPDAHAQDFKQALLAMQEKYRAMEKFHIVMQVKVFEEGAEATPFYHEKVEIRKDGARYRYRYGDQDLLMNERYLIMVDRTSREIVCNKTNPGAAQAKDPLQANMDSLFSSYGKPQYVGREGQADHYRLSLDRGEVSEVEIFIDPDQRVFRKIEYRYRERQRAVIDFLVFDTAPAFEMGAFDEQYYISVSKNRISPSKNFSSYHVVNVDTE